MVKVFLDAEIVILKNLLIITFIITKLKHKWH